MWLQRIKITEKHKYTHYALHISLHIKNFHEAWRVAQIYGIVVGVVSIVRATTHFFLFQFEDSSQYPHR